MLIVVELPRIPRNLRNTAMVLVASSVLLLPFAQRPFEAISRGVFVGGLFVSLMGAVSLLGLCATRDPRVEILGTYLRAQPVGRRYLGFTVASQFFSAMLSLAGANILFIMASSSPAQRRESAPMVVAVTRGFSAAIMWSPMFGNMAILLALYPTLHWIDVFPLGLLMAQATVLVGLVLHVGALRQIPANPPAEAAPAATVRAIAPLAAALIGFLAAVLAASWLLGVGTTAAIVLLAPVAAWLLNSAMARERPRFAAGARQLGQDLRRLPSLAPEATLLMSAGCAGTIMASAFPEHWALQVAEALGGSAPAGIAALMAALIAISLAGVHPVLTAVFLASTFTPPLLALPPIVHFCAILVAWGLAASITPFSMLSMTASRHSGIGLYRVSIGANWRFTVICVAVLTLGLSAAAMMLG